MNLEIRTVSVEGHLQAGERFEFLALDLATEPKLPLATAYYAVDGVREPYGLRLDLDKRIILDSLTDEALQDEADQCAGHLFQFLMTAAGARLVQSSPARKLALRHELDVSPVRKGKTKPAAGGAAAGSFSKS
ncbi:MAG: hypothetical protein ABI972_23045 [Acidobacteriota bacterium]